MVMESDVQSVEDGETDSKSANVDDGGGATGVEDESEEEEDVDFNPFLKETLSEASSSLSSEAEGLDTDVVNSHCRNGNGNDEGAANVVDEGGHGGGCNKDLILGLEREDDEVQDRENELGAEIDVVEDVVEAEVEGVSSGERNKAGIINFDDEDAICKRTRARYSLASFTLDELETFLQESDDDEDVQNVDEEEEYKKFLAAVLGGGNGDDHGNFEGNEDNDDEDNDADFEIEIEEALESDIDDCVETFVNEDKLERGSRRPETRQNGRQKANGRNKTKDSQQEKMPLRPLVPINPAPTVPCLGPRCFANETISPYHLYGQDHLSFGFQTHQIGQLYCLIYEHVQLLVQVYSLCVLDPSRQHIGSQIKGLLSELLHKRDLVLSWRNGSYPSSCFLPSFTYPSVSVENKKFVPAEDSGASPSDGQGSQWFPAVGSSVVSVLDVEPLKLVGKYMEGVSNAVREHQRRCLETTNLYLEKQPLFPHPICSSTEGECNISKDNAPSPNSNEVSPNYRAPKKTLAATLVESTKKQSVALVSPEIAKLAQPFYSLFNPALFPHKPPSSSVASRVLFTDAEDVLVAMGMIEYNNDWKAIQQRFLPCKTEHQIFVRAKNRCSSKAPDNPIKTVRKMKTSPLTEDEKVRIQEGLKAFKLDWTAVWRFVVPYRDPNLLPRQWRTAIGTQKSYKGDSAKRERHRIYESRRRRSKMGSMGHTLMGSEENASGEDGMDNENEAYVHEAFLADWRPTLFGRDPSKVSVSNQQECVLGTWPAIRSRDIQNGDNNHNNRGSQSDKSHANELPAAYMTHSYPASTLQTSGESLRYPRKAGKRSISTLVKLAPELPPVKLPSAVRVISQSSLKSSHLGSTSEAGANGPGLGKTSHDPSGFGCSDSSVKPTQVKNMLLKSNAESLPSQKDGLMNDRCPTKDIGTEMHPLLFRTIEEGHLPYYPVNSSLRIPIFSFFPAVQHQMNSTVVQSSCSGDQSFSSKEIATKSSNLDFHPLLKRAKEVNGGPLDSGLTSSFLNTDLELSRDRFAEDIVYNAGASAAATKSTSPSAGANDLDLSIDLNSSCKRMKVSGPEVDETNLTIPSDNETRVVDPVNEKTHLHCDLSTQPVDQNARSHLEISIHDSSALSDKFDGSNGLCTKANGGDHSLSEIVMEQEELSDSDEELEDVEFEREEMEDSDGEEELGSDHVDNVHNKQKSGIDLGSDKPAELLKSLVSEASEGTQVLKKGRKTTLVSVGPGIGHAKSSWLSLNSHGSHFKPVTRRTRRPESSERASVPSHPNRQSKKGISGVKDVSSSEQKTNISQQDSFANALKRHKKHSRSSSPLRVDAPSDISGCTEKDGKV